MKIKTFCNFVVVLCLFCAIWSHEPIKMILSGIFMYVTIKITFGNDKVIGKNIIYKHSPVDFSGVFNKVKF